MNKKMTRTDTLCAAAIAAVFMFAPALTQAEGIQVRSEAVIAGSNGSQDAIVVPDLYDDDDLEVTAFTYWVSPAGDRNFKTIGFRPTGGLIVQDGTMFREFRSNGSQRFSSAFPIDCTKLNFQSPKGQRTQDTFLADCQASVILLDNTMRIYGNVKGQGLKGIAYDLENPNGANTDDYCTVAVSTPAEQAAAELRVCGAYRVTKEPPPQITDAIADESGKAVEFRDGPRILVAGDRKSVFAIDITTDITELDSEDTVTPVATFNGSRINSFAVAGQYLVIAFDDGEIRRFDLASGADEYLFQHVLCEDPALGKKTLQRFAMRQDPDEVAVFALNRACGNLAVLDPTNLVDPVIDTDDDGALLFALTNVALDDSVETINPEAVDARPGESGTFADCEVGETCQLGQGAEQLTQSGSRIVEVETFDPGYRIFQSFLIDCRYTGDRPCPIVNCPGADEIGGDETGCPAPEEQILNLTELFIRSDTTGEVGVLVPNRDDPATIPGRFRGEKEFPNRTGNPVDCKYGVGTTPELCFNNYEFYSFFALSDVVFNGPFELTVDVDQFRLNANGIIISDDPCPVILPSGADDLTREEEVNDRANVVVHNRDRYDTIPDAVGNRKGAVLIDRACGSKKAGGYDWSWTSIGLEPADFTARDYLDFAKLQLQELFQVKEVLLCTAFDDPDTFDSVQILSEADCDLVQTELEQVGGKAGVCFDALLRPQQGDSRENCGALFAQIDNLVNTVENRIIRPDPAIAADILKLKPAYLAEFEARIGAFRFSTEEWLLKVTPSGGIPLP